MFAYIFLLALAFFRPVIGSEQVVTSDRRTAKWFLGGRVRTLYVEHKSIATQYLPSSCVVLATSLLPCRNVRNLPIEPTKVTRIQRTEVPVLKGELLSYVAQEAGQELFFGPRFLFASWQQPEKKQSEAEMTQGSSWAQYLGLEDAKTVTSTLYRTSTTKYLDSATVVTFSVKGCHPSRLPFDLPLCKNSSDSSRSKDGHIVQDIHYAT